MFPHSEGMPARLAVASTQGPSWGKANVDEVVAGSDVSEEVASEELLDVVIGRVSSTGGELRP
jgi:hypothetical protein